MRWTNQHEEQEESDYIYMNLLMRKTSIFKTLEELWKCCSTWIFLNILYYRFIHKSFILN